MEVRKIDVLGSGSYGRVFLVVLTDNVQFQLQLAMKTSYAENTVELIKEASILEEFVGCEGIVQSFGSFSGVEFDVRCHNLLLEYATGGTLLYHMSNWGGMLPEVLVQDYTKMLLKGLSAMHAKGIVHCDLKPGNILVFPSGDGGCQVKIADFGLSKVPGEEADHPAAYARFWTFRFRGTSSYMSPESVSYGLIETPLDIWSLGCVVIEMLTGVMPWEMTDDKSLMHLLVHTQETPSIPTHLSETGKDFLAKCLVRNPWQRWTANMLLDHPFVSQNQVPLPPPSLSEADQYLDFSSPLPYLDNWSSPVTQGLASPGWCPFLSSTGKALLLQ